MSNNVEQHVIDSFKTVIVALHKMDVKAAKLAIAVLPSAIGPFLNTRENIELNVGIVRELHSDPYENTHRNCMCLARAQYMLDALEFFEKQKIKEELVSEGMDTALRAWEDFTEKFNKAPVLTYQHTDYVLPTGVTGLYFMHPEAMH